MAPQPKVGTFAVAIPTKVANNQGKPSTKVGGFGDPEGVRPDPALNRTATVAAYGSFTSAIGGSSGSGAARKGTIGGVDFGSGYTQGVNQGDKSKVSIVGFSNGVAARGTNQAPHGTVRSGTFKENTVAENVPKKAMARSPNDTTVQVISHPRPTYTSEAKELKIQGEVVLEVRFTADGQVHVLRVVKGLGHGLDQQAIRVAEQTRFKPATRNGKPVDSTTYYRIDFQLA
jgi:TonB family protein